MKNSSFYDNVPLPSDDQITNCMRCGMCLPVCPTYDLTKMERHSPRGRIKLIKAVAEGELDITENFIDSIEFCLNCQACVTACPAGVEYGQLVEAAHFNIEEHKKRKHDVPLIKKILLNWLFLKQYRLRLATLLMRLYQQTGMEKLVQRSGILKLLSTRMHDLSFMLPKLNGYMRYPQQTAPKVKTDRPVKVGVLTGCVQDVFFNDVNHDTIQVLAYNGYEVYVPQNQQCCGSVHGHNGELDTARTLAKRMIDTFLEANVDYVVINSAGCGSFMKQYGTFLEDDPEYNEKAQRFVKKVLDISELLTNVGFIAPEGELNLKLSYHEPCHLTHGQKIKQPPRQILQSIPGIDFRELPESDWCCGSAGIYNITHYEASMELLERKMNNIKISGSDYIVTGNPGCLLQLMYGIKKFNTPVHILHPVTVLKMSYEKANGVNQNSR
ncbi:MAG: 4Fe-4S dicluster domain-containing protein [Caldithrix sp.]|nr:4Fe-4S dicluster domain-containing protein [Caldithrix sp.]